MTPEELLGLGKAVLAAQEAMDAFGPERVRIEQLREEAKDKEDILYAAYTNARLAYNRALGLKETW